MAHEASKTLKGTIKLNESLFLGKNEELEWKLLTMRNRIKETLVEDQKISILEMKDIDCSTGIL